MNAFLISTRQGREGAGEGRTGGQGEGEGAEVVGYSVNDGHGLICVCRSRY